MDFSDNAKLAVWAIVWWRREWGQETRLDDLRFTQLPFWADLKGALVAQWAGGEPEPKRAVEAAEGNPVCPNCRTIYNRSAVIRELRKLDPLMFDFGTWSTRFKCVKCGEEVGIAGSGNE